MYCGWISLIFLSLEPAGQWEGGLQTDALELPLRLKKRWVWGPVCPQAGASLQHDAGTGWVLDRT